MAFDIYKNRNLEYNNWHRKNLPTWCYASDIDFVEWRTDEYGNMRIAAIKEMKVEGEKRKQWQDELLVMLAKPHNVPALVVTRRNLEAFLIENLITGNKTQYTEKEYIEFLKKL